MLLTAAPFRLLRHKVLLVDDHPFVLDGISGILNSQPEFEVVGCASSVEEAAQLLPLLKPALVMTDLRLPDGDGGKVLQLVAKRRWETYGVVLSAFRADDDLLAAARHGARAYLLKTEGIARVLSVLRRVVQGDNVLVEEFPPALRGRLAQKDLSGRELEVLALVGQGLSNKQIARQAGVSENTIKVHLRRLFAKLGVDTRAEAAVIASQRGLVH